MQLEISRQLIHLSGILFIILAQFIGEIIVFYFALAAIFFLVYSEYVRHEQKQVIRFVDYMESKLRGIAQGLERQKVKRHFMGAFWFYATCSITFFLFPFQIATIACAILSISDALSTLIGHRYGKHRFMKNKSVEGSLTFLISAIAVASFFTVFWIAVAAAIVGTLAEIIPDIKHLEKFKNNHLLDDNWLIPILTALTLFLI